jgi:DNA (cytosine-5)-methyltransferase 1
MSGFQVVGVDRKAQQNWPWPHNFVKVDAMRALELLDLRVYDAIHASPPCQTHSRTRYLQEDRPGDPDEIENLRIMLQAIGKPYVIENVVGAPLEHPVTLCGSMFPETMGIRRHRIFECPWLEQPPPECRHELQVPRFRNPDPRGAELTGVVNVHGSPSYQGEAELRREVMGIDWMNNYELTQAVPPAYTMWLGGQLADYLARRR